MAAAGLVSPKEVVRSFGQRGWRKKEGRMEENVLRRETDTAINIRVPKESGQERGAKKERNSETVAGLSFLGTK